VIYSKTQTKLIGHVRQVLQKLRDVGLYTKVQKCEFLVTETKFLGIIIGCNGICMDPEKIKTIIDWQPPSYVTDVQAFIRFSNFYYRFIQNFSKIITLLINLTQKDIKFT
jgi:hypothetical protein